MEFPNPCQTWLTLWDIWHLLPPLQPVLPITVAKCHNTFTGESHSVSLAYKTPNQWTFTIPKAE